MERALLFRVISYDAFKDADRTVFRTKHLPRNGLSIDRIASDLIELTRTADRQGIRAYFTTTDGWKDGKLISLFYTGALINVLLIDGRQDNWPVVLDSRKAAFKMGQHIGDSCANRYIELHLPSADNVFKGGKE